MITIIKQIQLIVTQSVFFTHTYKLQVQAASAGTATVGRSFRELDQTGFDPRCSSTITLMEVAA